ncbi:flagellar motor switch protein FliN [Candidatus Bandiella numerosa]|jgi:flagellar motor switch protein FliN/FliY|uniref:flagellar motor switch protein FliN n=1 Tax=Candidatus Bandiella numerosa TaxID=2570586 RepID=UPI00249F0ECE|nr:flagellar motor switch protein FliN [Candidatus Bandiella numerosa]WHA05291.1 flagellar motor switch protein FliN [Candidatus Bandiella numerosa]
MTIEKEDIKNRNGINLNLKAIYDVPMKLKVVLGQAEFKVSDLLKLNKGDKIELDKKPGDPVDLFVNDKLVAKGEIVLIDDKVGLTLTEIIAND